MNTRGFTLIELIVIIVLVGILAIAAVISFPTDMNTEAARLEFIRAVRYAQHRAMTREYTGFGTAWGITVGGNQYTVERLGGGEQAETEYVGRFLLDNNAIGLTGPSIYFNALGEPIDTGSGAPLINIDPFIITADGPPVTVTVSPETGFVN